MSCSKVGDDRGKGCGALALAAGHRVEDVDCHFIRQRVQRHHQVGLLLLEEPPEARLAAHVGRPRAKVAPRLDGVGGVPGVLPHPRVFGHDGVARHELVVRPRAVVGEHVHDFHVRGARRHLLQHRLHRLGRGAVAAASVRDEHQNLLLLGFLRTRRRHVLHRALQRHVGIPPPSQAPPRRLELRLNLWLAAHVHSSGYGHNLSAGRGEAAGATPARSHPFPTPFRQRGGQPRQFCRPLPFTLSLLLHIEELHSLLLNISAQLGRARPDVAENWRLPPR